MRDVADPWARFDTESSPAFEAFTIYRDAGPSRSIRGVARELGKSGSLISRWSSRYSWKSRVVAWDSAQDQLRQLVLSSEVQDAARQHAQILRAHLAAVSIPALELARRIETGSLSLGDLDNGSLINLVCKAAKSTAQLIELEREVHGLRSDDESCERVRAQREIARLSDEELEARLLGVG